MKKRNRFQKFETTTSGPSETDLEARRFSAHLEPGSILVISGELGAGKTTFVKGLALGLGFKGDPAEIVSPTFSLVREYSCRLPLYHADLYRLQGLDDEIRGTLEECFDSGGVTALEWGERASGILPGPVWRVSMFHRDNDRRLLRIEPPMMTP